MMAEKDDRWLRIQLQIFAVALFLWGAYGLSFGKIWASGRSNARKVVVGPMRHHSFHTFTGGKARGMGLGMMLGAVGLLVLSMSVKRENRPMAFSGLGLMVSGTLVYLGSLILLSS